MKKARDLRTGDLIVLPGVPCPLKVLRLYQEHNAFQGFITDDGVKRVLPSNHDVEQPGDVHVIVAPVDYGALTSFLLNFLEDQGFDTVSIHEWEVRQGEFDDEEDGKIPEHITDDLRQRDLAQILWIGKHAKVPSKLAILEDVAAGHIEPTDT